RDEVTAAVAAHEGPGARFGLVGAGLHRLPPTPATAFSTSFLQSAARSPCHDRSPSSIAVFSFCLPASERAPTTERARRGDGRRPVRRDTCRHRDGGQHFAKSAAVAEPVHCA